MNNDQINYAIQLATKRLETTMIGALARFETSFGHLWGHHKDFDEKLSEKELYFDNIWQDLRNNILNHGNNQIRGLHTDLQKHLSNTLPIKYHYKFNTKTKEDDQ